MSKRKLEKTITKEELKALAATTPESVSEKPSSRSKLPDVGQVIKSRYLVLVKLGEGGYGAVYEVLEKRTKQHFAMKVEQIPKDPSGETLKFEMGILKILQGKKHVVKYQDEGVLGKYRFLVMQLAGRNLASLRRHCPKQAFTSATTVRIGQQCVEAVRDLHDAGFVHRDIKPANFSMGRYPENRRIVYILDYGLARRFRNKSGSHREEREKPGFRGTIRYAPLVAHQGRDMGRKDDIWSLLYMLVEFCTGRLPWRKYEEREVVGKIKERLTEAILLANMEPEYREIYRNLASLKFESKPAYDVYLKQLQKIIERKNYDEDAPFDWDQGGSHYKHTKYVKHQPYAKQMQKKDKVVHDNPTDPEANDDETEE